MMITKPSLLRFADFRDLGIPWGRKHIRTLVRANKFPAPIRLGANTLAWRTCEIDDWLASRPVGGSGATPAGFAAMTKARP